MAIKREKVEQEAKTIFSKEHIAKFRKVYEACSSAEDFFVKYGAIRVDDGQWTVLDNECKGLLDKITGLQFPNNFPYSFYRELESAMQDQDARRRYAEGKTIEGLINMDASNKAFKEASKGIKKKLKK